MNGSKETGGALDPAQEIVCTLLYFAYIFYTYKNN